MALHTPTTPGHAPAVNPYRRPLPGRRNVLGDAIAGLAGAVIIAGAGITVATPETLAAPTGPDAELLAACNAYDELERQYAQAVGAAKTFEDTETIEPQLERISAAQEPLVDRIVATPATTLQGLHAKAQSLLLCGGVSGLDSSYAHDRLLASLLSNLVGFEIRNDRQAIDEMHRRLGWEGAA